MPRGYGLSTHTFASVLLAALVAANALLRGGLEWRILAVSALAASAALGLVARLRTRRPRDQRASVGPNRGEGGVLETPALVVGLAAAVIWTALQLVPLPPAVVRILSPQAAETIGEALGPLRLFPSWRPTTLAPSATVLELVKAATWTAVAAVAAVLAASEWRRDLLLRAIALTGVAVTVVYLGAALLELAPLVAQRVTFVNPNHLAAFAQLASWTALGFALRARGPARAAWLVAFAFTASSVFLSGSRAGIASFFVAAGVFAVLRMRAAPRESSRAARRQRSASEEKVALRRHLVRLLRSSRAVFAGGVAAALAVSAWLALDPIVREMESVADGRTTEVKLGLWPSAVAMIRDYPIVGIGRGAFATVYPAYKSEPAQLTFTHVENEWLQLPLDLGFVPGVLLILAFAAAFLAAARRCDLSRPLAGALAGVAGVAVQNLFDFSLEIPGVAIPFTIILAIASRDLPGIRVRPWVLRASAAVALVVSGAALLFHVRHQPDEAAARVVAAPEPDAAIALAKEALRYSPADYVPPAAVGQKLAEAGRCGEAAPWLTRAMLRNPTAPEPHRAMARCLARTQPPLAKREYRLAFLYGDRSALGEANAIFRGPGELLEVAPETPDGLLAAGALLRGRPAEARLAYRRGWESFREPRALAALAATTLALDEHEEALRLARELQGVAQENPAGYVVASRALDAAGDGEGALRELEFGAARVPGSAEVLVPLGMKHLQARRFSQARATFERIAATEGAALARKRVLVARALEGQARYAEALREVQVARDVAPDDLGALEAFARLAEAAGRLEDAIDALETAGRKPAARPGAYDDRVTRLRERLVEARLRQAR